VNNSFTLNNTIMNIDNLKELADLTRAFAREHNALQETLHNLDADLQRIKRSYMRSIKTTAAKAADTRSALYNYITSNPGLFEKPRTVVLEGIKVGLTKGKGKIDWEDDEQVCKLIHKHFEDRKDVLIKSKETPIVSALQDLSVSELKRIGVTAAETGDKPVIKPVTGDIDKIIAKLLADEDGTAEAKEAV
jgi:hypothetical protein